MNDKYCEDIVEINNVIMLNLTIKLNFSSSILPFFIFCINSLSLFLILNKENINIC